MKKGIFILFSFWVIFLMPAKAQLKIKSFHFAATNTHTTLPIVNFPKLFYKQFHPGLNGGISLAWKEGKVNHLEQTINLGYFYHRYAQHGIMLYTEFSYRRDLNRFFADGRLGAGYLHSIPDINTFSLNSNGEYQKDNGIGRPQFMPSVILGTGYYLNETKTSRIFLNYQMWFQLPFVKSYVPVLPNSTLQLGVAFPIAKKETTDENIE